MTTLWTGLSVLPAAALLAVAGTAGWRGKAVGGLARRAWLLLATATVCLAGSAALFVGAGPHGAVQVLGAVGLVVLAVSIGCAARVRDSSGDRSTIVDGLLVAVAGGMVAVHVAGSGRPTTGSLLLGAGGLLLLAVLVRFWLTGGAWSSATLTFQAGTSIAVVAALAWACAGDVAGSQWWLGLMAVAATLWLSGVVNSVAPETFRLQSLERRPRASRSGVLATIVVVPIGVLAHAYADGRALSPWTYVALGTLVVLLAVRVAAVRGAGQPASPPALLAAAAVFVWGGAATTVEVNATAQRLTDQRAALMVYQRDLLDRMRPVSGYAIGSIPRRRLIDLQAQTARDAARLPLASGERALVQASGTAWIDSIIDINQTLDSPAPGSVRDRLLQRAGAATTQAISELRAVSDRYAAASQRAGVTARRVISALTVAVALALALLLRAYTRMQRRTSNAHEREDALRGAMRRTELLLDASADVVLILDHQLRIRQAHGEQLSRIFGARTPAGLALADYVATGAVDLYRQQISALLASRDERADAVWELIDHGGAALRVDVRMVDARQTPDVGTLVLSFKDLRKHTQIAAAVQSTQGRDPLTGLGDRSALQRYLGERLTRPEAGPLALLKLDLRDFRSVNEQLGVTAGDELLRETAQRLAGASRGGQLARVGGNVFVCVIETAARRAEIENAAHRLLESIEAPFTLSGSRAMQIQAAAGIAVWNPGQTATPQSLLRDAELAMYEAKADQGTSLRFFTDELAERARPRLSLRSDLLTALVDEQFRLVYQPIVRATTQDVVGYEALLRWEHPTLGTVSPAEFIPLAERTGLIVELGEWVLRTATAQLAQWAPYWPDNRYVTVNVATQQLEQPTFSGLVEEALRGAGLSPAQLVLEITESALITDQTTGAERLRALQDLGVRVAIDDFGTGYSSLNYLHRFAVDFVKLDKSFIDQITTDRRTLTLVTAIAHMAAGLDLTLVAEGVEDAGQLRALKGIGCPLIQGYHFSPPMAAADVLGFRPPTTSVQLDPR